MKKLVVSALAAAALVFGFASCATTSGTSSGSSSKASASTAPAAAPAPAALAEGTSAAWDFAKKPADGIITTDYKTFSNQIEIPFEAGSAGAKFFIAPGGETKYLTENGDTFIATNAKTSVSLADPKQAKGKFALTLEEAATVSIEISGNGDPAASRLVAIAGADDVILAGKDQLGKSPKATITAANLPVGTYTVYANGARLHKITITK